MRLILFTVVVAFVVGVAAGGELRRFPSVKLRWWWLALAGIALQFAPVEGRLAVALLLLSFACLILFAIVNLRAPGFILILTGLLLNTLVISVNQGMPVSRHALMASHQADTLTDLVRNGGAKHHLADEDTRMLALGDVIVIGPPINQAMSAGDVAVYLGVAWFIVLAMPRRRRPTTEAEAVA